MSLGLVATWRHHMVKLFVKGYKGKICALCGTNVLDF